MSRILVTGASGFVGTRIMEIASSLGHEIIGTRTSRTIDDSLVAIDTGDAATFGPLRQLGQVDAVIHAAGIAHRTSNVGDDEYHRVNALGARNVASLAIELEAKRFVLISSVLVYGRAGREPGRCVSETDDRHPADAYAQSKLDGERMAAEVCAEANLPIAILRPAPIVGEGCRGNFDRLIRAIDRGRFVEVGRGLNRKSIVYVADVARAAVKAAISDVPDSQVINIAADDLTTGEIVEMITRGLGRSRPPLRIPAAPALGLAAALRVTPLRSLAAALGTWLAEDVYCTDRSRDAGFEIEVSAREAIASAVSYFRKHRE